MPPVRKGGILLCSGTSFLYEYWKDYVKMGEDGKKRGKNFCKNIFKNLQEWFDFLYYTALERRSQCRYYEKNVKFSENPSSCAEKEFAGKSSGILQNEKNLKKI